MAVDYNSMANATPDNASTYEMLHRGSEEKNPINNTVHHDTFLRANDENEYPGSLKLVSVVVALVLAVFLASLDMNIIATAIPRITDEFHSLDQVKPICGQTTDLKLTCKRSAGMAPPCS